MKNSFLTYTLATLVVTVVFTFVAIAGGDKKPSKKNIIETAVSAGKFTTLAKALTEAGLIETLKQEGPFTVFAPTDEAFAKIPQQDLANLLRDKEALKQVLLYHVVSGKVLSSDVVKLTSAKTVQGSEVKILVQDNTVMVNAAKVIAVDVEASNGVIHVIDRVILPPAPEHQHAK